MSHGPWFVLSSSALCLRPNKLETDLNQNAKLMFLAKHWFPPGLSTDMAIHVPGRAVDLYRQIPRLLGAKLSGRIGPDMPGSLTAQMPTRLYGQIPGGPRPVCMGKSRATPGSKLAICLVEAVPALLGLPPCMPPPICCIYPTT